MEYIRWLDHLHAADVARAGGKAVSLGRLRQAGVPVPRGFVVLATAFDAVLDANGIRPGIIGRLRTLQPGTPSAALHAVSEQIATVLHEAVVPSEVRAAILAAYIDLGAPAVAVRSSAAAEDHPDASWAGVLETDLNTNSASLLPSVRRCWASLFTPRALAYRTLVGADPTHLAMGVLVQTLVESEVAGVAFSIDPISGNPERIVIEAALGLGEALVTGQITPDRYVVKVSEGIVEKAIRRQTRASVSGGGSAPGTVWVAVPGSSGGVQKLADAEIIHLAQLVRQIAFLEGYPVDVEWARTAGTFAVLQSRPVQVAARPKRPTVPSFVRDQAWKLRVTRPFDLFAASLIAAFISSARLQQLAGAHLPDSLYLQRPEHQTSYYRVREQEEALRQSIATRLTVDHDGLHDVLRHGVDLSREAGRILSQQGARFTDLAPAIDFLRELFLHGTVLPFEIMTVIDQEGLDLPDLFALGEQIRSVSLYPALLARVVRPLAQRRLAELGVSNAAMSLAVLTWDELTQGRLSPAAERVVAAREGRRFVYRHEAAREWIEWLPPGTVDRLLAHVGEGLPASAAGDMLYGTTAFPGTAQGIARVVVPGDSETIGLQPGEILVSVNGAPALYEQMMQAAAFVTDEGGVACHAAIYARQLGIPCIMGTQVATTRIPNGAMIAVDATVGVVRILDERQ